MDPLLKEIQIQRGLERRCFVYALYAVMLLLCACSNEGINSSHGTDDFGSSEIGLIKDSLHNGMVLVRATGAHTYLGTVEKLARTNEKPAMKVLFDYDFSIGEHEITCDEFGDEECSSDDDPVSNVTFFDAALFANERSKKEGFDSAYVYTKKVMDDKGHCIGLENFEFKTDVNAYRLPTEAEWVLVANQNWEPQESWNSTNSDFKKNKVCSIETMKGPVCDMAGNVAEWVNDWMGLFADTTVTNFIGSESKRTQGERVVKGRSYRNNPQDMYVYTRGDIYTVVSSTKAEYVGFRLAFGAIPSPNDFSFDHSEWAVGSKARGGRNVAVATLTNSNGAHKKIVAIDVDQKNIITLVEGDELWHPCWNKLEETEILLVGNSRTEWGLNPDLYPGMKMVNVGVSGVDAGRDLYFIRNYALNHADHLKAITMSLDLDNWRGYEDHLKWKPRLCL